MNITSRRPRFLSRDIFAGALLLSLPLVIGAAQGAAPVVTARTVLGSDAAHAGSSVKAAVVAEIPPGYHINERKPTLDYLIPTELKLEPTKELVPEKSVYPKGELKKFAFADTALSVYEGKFVVGTVLKVEPHVAPGTYNIRGKLSYQACNDRACFPPKSVPVSLAVKVVPRGVPLRRVN